MTRHRAFDGEMVEWDPMPDNDEAWWIRSHCGPGNLDGNELCECGETCHDCAQYNTEHIFLYKEQLCGCSGFWCHNCKLFYPQDVCWETYGDEYKTASGIKAELRKDGYVYCRCGQKLFKEPKGISEEE